MGQAAGCQPLAGEAPPAARGGTPPDALPPGRAPDELRYPGQQRLFTQVERACIRQVVKAHASRGPIDVRGDGPPHRLERTAEDQGQRPLRRVSISEPLQLDAPI